MGGIPPVGSANPAMVLVTDFVATLAKLVGTVAVFKILCTPNANSSCQLR
jgi:hypothetical protein